MQTRARRFVLVGILLAGGVGAAFSTWSIAQRVDELGRSEQETADRIDHLLATVTATAFAQQSYVTPASDGVQAGRIPALIEQIRAETIGVRPHVRSLNAGRTLQSVADGASALGDIEGRAQEHVRLGQDSLAADVIVSEARTLTDAIAAGLRDLRVAESVAVANARASALKYAWTVIGSVAVIWMLGLILLAWSSASRATDESLSSSVVPSVVARAEVEPIPVQLGGPDLSLAAELCTAMARLTAADDLPGLLKRAASILDASGIVVWMAAGEELFAASAFGYQPQVISRLGPINRGAINATAAAWRTGTMQIVIGERGGQGAVVAPMLGPDRCVGVLAVELPYGREEEPVIKAVTTMVAAQLTAALAGWPAGSAAAPVDVPPLDKVAEA